MIGVCRFWQQHHHRVTIGTHELQFAKYLDYMGLKQIWNVTEEELRESQRLNEKVQLGGELTAEEDAFMRSFLSKTNNYDIYALCFVEPKTGDEVKAILDALPRAESVALEEELMGLSFAQITTDVPAMDEVHAFLMCGFLPMSLTDMTIQQGLIIAPKLNEMITERNKMNNLVRGLANGNDNVGY